MWPFRRARKIADLPYTRQALAGHGYEIGEHSYGVPQVHWKRDAKLRIGKYCSIADHVHVFLGGAHRADWITTYPFPQLNAWPQAHAIAGYPVPGKDVTIGNDVWLCEGCIIMPGVTIGDGAIVAAFSVVAKDVPPYTLVAGNPAEPKKKRFSDGQIAKLLALRWWDWPEDKIRRHMALLCSGDVETLLAQSKKETAS